MVATLLSFIRPRKKEIGSFTWSASKLCFHGFLHMTTQFTIFTSVPSSHVSTFRYAPRRLEHAVSRRLRCTTHNPYGFSQLPVDQTIAQPLNHNTKTKGNIIRFSLKKGSMQWWVLTAHARASLVDRCREMASSHPQDERKGQ